MGPYVGMEEEEFDPVDTGRECTDCEGTVYLGDEVVLLQVATSMIDEYTRVRFLPIPEHGACLVHYECFEGLGEDLTSAVQDVPPNEEPGAVITCDYCQSTMRIGEKVVLATMGDMELSARQQTPVFVPSVDLPTRNESDPFVFCLSCAHHIIDEMNHPTWVSLSQNTECYGCTKAKCWRHGRCTCNCHRE